MKKTLLAGFATGLIVLGATTSATAIPLAFDGHYYELIESTISWEDARDASSILTHSVGSQIFSGHLATISSYEENTFITNNLLATSLFKDAYYLGGYQTPTFPETYLDYSLDWNWVTGEEWSYTNWRIGEPNNDYSTYRTSEEHLEIYYTGGGVWNDVGSYEGSGRHGYIVEYESAPVPEPATMLLFGTGLVGLVGSRLRKKRK